MKEIKSSKYNCSEFPENRYLDQVTFEEATDKKEKKEQIDYCLKRCKYLYDNEEIAPNSKLVQNIKNDLLAKDPSYKFIDSGLFKFAYENAFSHLSLFISDVKHKKVDDVFLQTGFLLLNDNLFADIASDKVDKILFTDAIIKMFNNAMTYTQKSLEENKYTKSELNKYLILIPEEENEPLSKEICTQINSILQAAYYASTKGDNLVSDGKFSRTYIHFDQIIINAINTLKSSVAIEICKNVLFKIQRKITNFEKDKNMIRNLWAFAEFSLKGGKKYVFDDLEERKLMIDWEELTDKLLNNKYSFHTSPLIKEFCLEAHISTPYSKTTANLT